MVALRRRDAAKLPAQEPRDNNKWWSASEDGEGMLRDDSSDEGVTEEVGSIGTKKGGGAPAVRAEGMFSSSHLSADEGENEPQYSSADEESWGAGKTGNVDVRGGGESGTGLSSDNWGGVPKLRAPCGSSTHFPLFALERSAARPRRPPLMHCICVLQCDVAGRGGRPANLNQLFDGHARWGLSGWHKEGKAPEGKAPDSVPASGPRIWPAEYDEWSSDFSFPSTSGDRTP